MDIKALAQDAAPYVVERRHYYHQHPELTGEEKNTRDAIHRDLEALGITDIRDMVNCYGLVATIHGGKPGMSVARYRTSLRARAWNLMRIKMWLSVDDMLMTLADGSEKCAEKDLRRYIRALRKAGYIAHSTRNPQLFRLVNNTGRNAPAYNTKRETVTDTNTGEVHHV